RLIASLHTERCREAINRGGLVPTALNGANEEAVHLFLNGKIHFLDIPVLVRAASQAQDVGTVTYQNIVMADADARTFVRKAAQRLERK
ncbi:MAG TPA: hypothetical protein DEP42_02790, partial [Ruminococcaceae bacterium]|nr:hypothetical protein [Oscillospiraceae bacterium]